MERISLLTKNLYVFRFTCSSPLSSSFRRPSCPQHRTVLNRRIARTRQRRRFSGPRAFVPHQELYHTTDAPISWFGFATGFHGKYVVEERLGSGTFGTVSVARDRATGERFAVKRMPKRFDASGSLERYYVRRVRNEVDICNHLGRSLNVAYLYGTYEDDFNVDLVMELCTGGELWDAIKARGCSYSERDAARLTREILRTVAQCHAEGVLMRDVKPENFLFASLEENAPLKAIDFGISVFCDEGQEVDVRAGTPIFIAPEVLRCAYSLPADLWSVGIIAYMLLTGRLPFSGEEGDEVAELYMTQHVFNNKDVFRAVLYSDLDFESHPWDVISLEARGLVTSLLSRDPALRPTAAAALQHPWLAEQNGDKKSAPLGDSIVQRLQRYGTFGRLKQAALRKVAHAALHGRFNKGGSQDRDLEGISLPEALQSAFSRLDLSRSGRVALNDLRAELQGGHFNLKPEEADQLLVQLEPDGDGAVDFEAWVAAMTDWHAVRESTEWDLLVVEAFKSADIDGDDALGIEDLEALLCPGEEGCQVPDVVEAALREADGDHDGSVSLEEFRRLLSGHEGDLGLFDPRLVQLNTNDEGIV